MEKRRQNQSCDQCRRAKKACDGYLVNGSQRSTIGISWSTSRSPSHSEDILPCSYCVRTAKKCSLNPHWANAQLGKDRTLEFSFNNGHESPVPDFMRPNLRSHEVPNAGLPTPVTLGSETDTMLHGLHNLHGSPKSAGWTPSFVLPEQSAARSMNYSMGPSGFDEMEMHRLRSNQPNPYAGNHPWDFMFEANQMSSEQLIDDGLNCFNLDSVGTSSSNPSNIDDQSTNCEQRHTLSSHRDSFSSMAPMTFKRRKTHYRHPTARDGCQARLQDSNDSLSPFTALHTLAEHSNRTLISDSLLRIYHDVIENNFACWINEDTCPYQMESFRQHSALEQRTWPEWGAAWSNRMYRRVKQLDRIAQATKLIQLTSSENRAASRALDLVVMAFATQWAQGKRRKVGTCQATWDQTDEGSDFGELDEDFERNLQYSTWESAKRALQNVSDLECFRVIYAELVFGLIQKPWMPQDGDDYHGFADYIGPNLDTSSILAHITRVMAQDGPPIFLERGTRKIHALRHRLEAKGTGDRKGDSFGSNSGATHAAYAFGPEEKSTVGLLYWLAIMFDTVSSSLNERPVVVVDGECEHDSQRDILRDKVQSRTLIHKWRLDLYAQDDPDQPSPLQWPCPYEDATRAVARSAAVKVLLFRYISYLQSALRNGEGSHALEEIIQETMVVYRYWNKTHGAFFRDLTDNFEMVPARIKSWFPCISIPWHLGSLMFADILDVVDKNQLGLEHDVQERICTNVATRIRRSSAMELADLATVIVPQELGANINQEQLQDFHFAVRDSSLLTEPWTVLLVRAFTKAALFHLGEAEGMGKLEQFILGHDSKEFQATVRRGQDCVRALWFLATKSDMAKSIAKALARFLQSFEAEMSTETVISGST